MLEVILAAVINISIMSQPVQQKNFSFVVIGDTQEQKSIMKKASLDMRSRGVDFVAHLGDIDYCGPMYKWSISRKLMALSGLPWYITIGNHELYKCGMPLVSWYSKERWSKYWWGDKKTFHVIEHKGSKFVYIDSSTFYYPNGEVERLELVLKNAKDSSVFLFTHMPLAYDKSNKRIYYGLNKAHWNYYSSMGGTWYSGRNKLLWHTLKRYKSKLLAVFHGHYHAYRSYDLDGIPVYCCGGGGGALETRRDFYHYLVVSVVGDRYFVKVIRI